MQGQGDSALRDSIEPTQEAVKCSMGFDQANAQLSDVAAYELLNKPKNQVYSRT